MIQRRSIVACILLSLVTCGLYGLYWLEADRTILPAAWW